MNDLLYWIWLQQALGYGSNKLIEILRKVDSIEDFYHLGLSSWISLSIFTKRELLNLSKSLDESKKICENCNRLGYKIVPYNSSKFPEILRKISDSPCVLYVKGKTSVLSNECISIVGSRSATVYGAQMAHEISFDLSKMGITIVSGCALGTDTAAHRGAIDAKGITIGVLACGIDYPYLVKNASLREKISNFGALISEFPPGYQIRKYNFPIRNRIISGISNATVIIEAGKRSGAIITANIAADQGRDVFVVPVKFDNPLCQGVNSLIEDGAKVITCAEDIVRESFCNKPKDQLKFTSDTYEHNKKKLPHELQSVLDAIGNQVIHINKLVNTTNTPIKNLSAILMRLELMHLVTHLPGKFYKKK